MKTANDITKAYNEAYRKDNDLIFFLLGGTVSNFLEEQYKKAKSGYKTFPHEMSYESFEEKFYDAQIARKIFQRAGFDVTFFTTPTTGHLFWKKPGVRMASFFLSQQLLWQDFYFCVAKFIPLATTSFIFSIKSSISFGVTIKL